MNQEKPQTDQPEKPLEDSPENLIDDSSDSPAETTVETLAGDLDDGSSEEAVAEEISAETVTGEAEVSTPFQDAPDNDSSPSEALEEATIDAESIGELIAESESEEAERIKIIASNETLAISEEEAALNGSAEHLPQQLDLQPVESEENITATREELKPVIEALLFVAEEPLPFKQICKVLGEVPEEDVKAALTELVADYDARQSGLEIREIAGGWRISTRPQNHEFIRKYLKSRPSARLSLPALETLAVIAYKQPITVPEILEIRGVTSSSAIKTLLEKRLIVTKGRKETVGRPMMYGTSKEFLIQFGLKDLTELPSIEDFEDLAQ